MLLSDELLKIVAYTKYLPNCDTKPLFKLFIYPHIIVLAGGQIFPAARELKNKQIGFHVWADLHDECLLRDVVQVLPEVYWVN